MKLIHLSYGKRFGLRLHRASGISLILRGALWHTLAASVVLTIWSQRCHAQLMFPSDPLRLLNAVLSYRIYFLGDSTKFDACAAFEAAGKPADFPEGIDAKFLPLLDPDISACSRPPQERGFLPGPHAVVTNLAVTSASGELQLIIRRGEYQHLEKYSLYRNQLVAKEFTLDRVTIWGFSHVLGGR